MTFRDLIKPKPNPPKKSVSHFWETRGNGNESASTSSENNKQRALKYGGSGALTGCSSAMTGLSAAVNLASCVRVERQ